MVRARGLRNTIHTNRCSRTWDSICLSAWESLASSTASLISIICTDHVQSCEEEEGSTLADRKSDMSYPCLVASEIMKLQVNTKRENSKLPLQANPHLWVFVLHQHVHLQVAAVRSQYKQLQSSEQALSSVKKNTKISFFKCSHHRNVRNCNKMIIKHLFCTGSESWPMPNLRPCINHIIRRQMVQTTWQ